MGADGGWVLLWIVESRGHHGREGSMATRPKVEGGGGEADRNPPTPSPRYNQGIPLPTYVPHSKLAEAAGQIDDLCCAY
jgi:hypothetical protein